jgi:DNA-binding beta-propeller fold protein YncE
MTRFLGVLTLWCVLAGTAQADGASVGYLARWPALNGSGFLDGPFDVACQADGTVLVSHVFGPNLLRFTSTGIALASWPLSPLPTGDQTGAGMMAIDGSGNVYLAVGLGYVQKLSSGGAFITQWRLQSIGTGTAPNAFGIAVGSDGNVFVSDGSSRNIQKFSPSGQFIKRWGSEGTGPGQFLTVSGLAADGAGRLYALDSGGDPANHRVQVFDLEGNFLFQWGSQGSGNGQFETLTDAAVSASGHVFVSDETLKRVQEFLPDGSFVGAFGSEGTLVGQFQYPAGICADASGNVFVTDLFGKFINQFGPVPVAATPVSWGRLKANYR